MLHIVVPPVATTVCQSFATTHFDNSDGTFDAYMTADLSIPATGAEYKAVYLFASLMAIVWVAGLPLGLALLLFSRRREIEARTTRRGGKELEGLSFFFRYERASQTKPTQATR